MSTIKTPRTASEVIGDFVSNWDSSLRSDLLDENSEGTNNGIFRAVMQEGLFMDSSNGVSESVRMTYGGAISYLKGIYKNNLAPVDVLSVVRNVDLRVNILHDSMQHCPSFGYTSNRYHD